MERNFEFFSNFLGIQILMNKNFHKKNILSCSQQKGREKRARIFASELRRRRQRVGWVGKKIPSESSSREFSI